jgi:cytidylate kinase
MPVITIGREYGAGGEAVGQLVAARLGADYVDRKIFEEVARRLELPEAEVEAQDEAPDSLLTRILTSLGSASIEFSQPPEVAAWSPPYKDPAFDPRKAIVRLSQEIIREAARSGNAVIIGRGSAFLLRDQPGALHVFLRAAEPFRIETARGLFGFTEEEARKKLKQTDANRAAYIRQLYGHDWQHPAHYDLVIDSGRLGFEGAAEVVVAAARSRARIR